MGPIIAGAVVLLFVILLFASGYLKAPPDTAYIITGPNKRRILIGKAGWRMPFFTRVDRLSLRVMQVDVKTSEAVPTNEFINVTVDGVANIKISSDPSLLERASESLLNMHQNELIALVTQVLEGNMREIVGSVGLKEMVQDRQGVAKKITENVVPDMQKLGIEVVNFNIQNFRDAAGTIENMGIDNVEQIRKNAQIAKANAQQEANAVRVVAEKKVAEQNDELAVQQADMTVRSETKRAEADAAYSIQQENQRKTIEVTKVNADIAKKEKEAELAEKEIALRERQLDAEVRKQADAMKYQAEQQAAAELVKSQREAEAQRYRAEQEAAGIRAKGLAEAEAIERKAEAQKKMGEASVLEMYLQALPEVVRNAAMPLEKTDKIVMYGDGNSTRLVRDVMNSTNQVVDGLKQATGIDLSDLIGKIANKEGKE